MTTNGTIALPEPVVPIELSQCSMSNESSIYIYIDKFTLQSQRLSSKKLQVFQLVVEPTPLKHMFVKMGIIFPNFRCEDSKNICVATTQFYENMVVSFNGCPPFHTQNLDKCSVGKPIQLLGSSILGNPHINKFTKDMGKMMVITPETHL